MIRLQRAGKKKQAFFRVVLQEKDWKTQGKAIELLGFYNPNSKEKKFNVDRIKHWLSKGAQASPTVHNLLVEEKVIDGPKVQAWKPKKKKKADEEVADKKAPTPDGRGPDSPEGGVGKKPAEEDKKEEDVKEQKEKPKEEEKPNEEKPASTDDASQGGKEEPKEDKPEKTNEEDKN